MTANERAKWHELLDKIDKINHELMNIDEPDIDSIMAGLETVSIMINDLLEEDEDESESM